MKAVILAGGLGTRLRPVTGEHPKPMAPLLGRPIMEHIVERLRACGYTQLSAALHYRAGEIMAHFGDGRRFGVSMEYRIETDRGWNLLTVSGGRVAVTAASCPDGDCLRCGAQNSGPPIVCLPNRLSVQFSDDGGLDGVVR